jgi:hypothetical protein
LDAYDAWLRNNTIGQEDILSDNVVLPPACPVSTNPLTRGSFYCPVSHTHYPVSAVAQPVFNSPPETPSSTAQSVPSSPGHYQASPLLISPKDIAPRKFINLDLSPISGSQPSSVGSRLLKDPWSLPARTPPTLQWRRSDPTTSFYLQLTHPSVHTYPSWRNHLAKNGRLIKLYRLAPPTP